MTDFNATEMGGQLGKWDWMASEKVAFSVIEKPATTLPKNATLSQEMALVHVCFIIACFWNPE